jgi:peptide/nickel transport system substrate-binding protein
MGRRNAITCEDFEFTRNAVMHTSGAYAPEGYDRIASIDCTDPRTAILHFTDLYIDWPDLFGGATGVVLERAAFPEQKDDAEIDLTREMLSDVPFSGGPWRLQLWGKDQAVLVRNENYWGHTPNFDRVTIVPTEDPSGDVRALRSGKIDAMFSRRGDMVQLGDSDPQLENFRVDPGHYYRALWMDVSRFPFNDRRVREALFWAVDRAAVLDSGIGPHHWKELPLNCGVLAIPGSFWCDQQPFAQFYYDPDMVAAILRKSGWRRDSRGYWARGGRRLAFTYTTIHPEERITALAKVSRRLRAAGFKVTSRLFHPELDESFSFQLGDFAETATADPSVTDQLGCGAIPTARNDYQGENAFHWCNREATRLMRQSDRELDPETRRALLDWIYQIEVQEFAPGLPLYVTPHVTAWRTDTVAGPVGEWNGTFYGGYFNIDAWYCARAGTCG